jgi:DNA-binding NarL/FixJ family response regulator
MSILIQNAKVTQTERRVCLLVLLGWGTLEISNVLGLKQSSVSSAKKELYRKITGADGSARVLKDEIVKRIYASER